MQILEPVHFVEAEAEDGKGGLVVHQRLIEIDPPPFIVDKDGDGYFWFGKYGRDRENTYSTMYSLLEEIVNKEGVLNPQEPDGRLKVSGM